MSKIFLSLGLILISGTSFAIELSCVASLDSQPVKVQGGLIIQRVAPVELDAVPKPAANPALQPPIPKASFADRVRITRTLHESGIFMGPAFGSMLRDTLGTYAKLIQQKDSEGSKPVDIPYEDLAKTLLKRLIIYHLSDSFTAAAAKHILSFEGKSHYDLSNIRGVCNQTLPLFSTPAGNQQYFEHSMVLANAIIDMGEENMVLTLKEVMMHVMGSIISYHQTLAKNVLNHDTVSWRKQIKEQDLAAHYKGQGKLGVRGWSKVGLTIGTVIGAMVTGFNYDFVAFGTEMIAGSMITWGLPKIDYITLYLHEKMARHKLAGTSSTYDRQIRKRIEYSIRDTVEKPKTQWFNWFNKESDDIDIADIKATENEGGPLDSLNADLKNLQSASTKIERSLAEITQGTSNTLNLGLLEQMILKTHSLLAMSLMVLENDLDFGTLSHIHTLSSRLTKAKSKEDLAALSVSAQQLLYHVQAQMDLMENLQMHLMTLRGLTNSYSNLIAVNVDKASATDLLETLDSSIEALDDSISTISTTKQNLIYLKISLTNFGNIHMTKNVKLLSDKMIQAHEALRNSLPGMQICMTGGAEQCISVNKGNANHY